MVSFFTRELLGLNEPPDYRETQLIEQDLNDAGDRDAAEEEVREGKITLFGQDDASGHSESDATESDAL